jgi:hypothetical protein
MLKAEKINKLLAISLTALLLFFYTLSPVLTYAQVVSPTPDPSAVTPTPDPTTVITPTPTPDPSITVTPTPDPSSVTPTPDPTTGQTNASNSADLTNTANSNAVTGDNSITATGSAGLNSSNDQSNNSSSGGSNSGSSSSTTATGDAVSVVNGQNSVNSTLINSNVIYQTLNIYVAQNGDLNLSDPFIIATNAIQTHPNDPIINVYVTNINNYVYLTNNISSVADTGNNTTNAPNSNANISTGNAASVVSLLNQVNFTATDSQIHIININIFGNLNGNIILPDPSTSTNCSGCGINLSASSSASISNNLNSTADTGNNTASGSATIQTGNANSAVNTVNLVNANLVGVNSQILYINLLGTWTGNFIGWGNLSPEQGGASMVFYNLGAGNATGGTGCTSCVGSLNINSNAFVTNNINSSANSGGNSINSNSGSITTGNAFSVISLINLVNTNFINSFGFFGFINIFGNWNGNIGGLSNFLALNNNGNGNGNQGGDNAPDTNSNINSNPGNASTVQEQGGQLSVTQTNNVGAFVYPGDTVTFSIKVRNIGTGKVYKTKAILALIYNGQIAGGTTFDLQDIPANTGKGITTGIVLSKNAPGGLYTARVIATGNVGPDNSTVTAGADSNFNILNNFAYANNTQSPHVTVLGAHNKAINNFATKNAQNAPYLVALILVLLAYLLVRGVKKRRYLANLLSSADFKAKLSSLRMFLF